MLLCRFSFLFFYALMNFCLLHGIDFLLRFLHLLQEFHIFFHNRKMSGGISRCDSSPWPSPRLNTIFFGFFFISAVLGFLVKSVDWSQFTGMVSFLNSYGLWLIIVGGIILFSISYIISKHIYQKKEF